MILTKYFCLTFCSNSPTNSLTFQLSFGAPIGAYLEKIIKDTLDQKAPHVQEGGFDLLNFEDLKLIWDNVGVTVSVSNFTAGYTISSTPTSTVVIQSTRVIIYCTYFEVVDIFNFTQ
ncbi:hypothetical protein ACJMK2_019211, partial [Sinanodonta woodiana]